MNQFLKNHIKKGNEAKRSPVCHDTCNVAPHIILKQCGDGSMPIRSHPEKNFPPNLIIIVGGLGYGSGFCSDSNTHTSARYAMNLEVILYT